MKKTIIILTTLSAVVAIIAILNDPFSIPFQDWDQMPKDQQNYYINKSKEMGLIKNIFGSCSILGITYLFLNFIFGKSEIKNEKNRTNGSS